MVFGVQKVGFCIAKVWFLFFKRVFFVLQYIIPRPRISTKWRCDFPPLVLQCRYFYLLYPTFCHVHPVGVGADLSCPYPRNSTKRRCIFALLALQFISFRHIKTIWFGLKNGRDESPPTPCGMFAAIHLRNK